MRLRRLVMPYRREHSPSWFVPYAVPLDGTKRARSRKRWHRHRQRGLRSRGIDRQRREKEREGGREGGRKGICLGARTAYNRDALIMGLRKQCCPVSNRLPRYPDVYSKPRKMQQLHTARRSWSRVKSLSVSWRLYKDSEQWWAILISKILHIREALKLFRDFFDLFR